MVMRRVEEALGLPPLKQIADSFEKFPDEKQIRAIRDVLVIAERVAQSAPQIEQVVLLIKEINSMPLEKLEKLEKLLKRIERIITKAPQDLIDFLTSLKGE